jgi:hypothetical protein
MRVARPLAVLVLALLALPTADLHASGWPHDPGRGLPVTTAPHGQCLSGAVTDSKGGIDLVYCEPCSSYAFPYPPLPATQYHAVHLLKSGDVDPAWPPASRTLPPLSAFTGTMLADGQGGFFLGWEDARNNATSGYDIYAHHVRGDGSLDPVWPATGRAVCTAPGRQTIPLLCGDGQGGVILAWSDKRDSVTNLYDVYAARVRSDGTLDPAWPANGRVIYAGAANQIVYGLVPDGAGGALVVWQDSRNGGVESLDAYAQHVLGNGTLDPAWPAGGLDVSPITDPQQVPQAVTDGAGGVFVTWDDYTNGDRVAHARANGTLDPAWPATGLVLDPGADLVFAAQVLEDGHGGVLIACNTLRTLGTNRYEILIRHVLPNGAFDPSWPAGGLRLASPTSNLTLYPGIYSAANMVSDGREGLLLSFTDDLDATGTRLEWRFLRVRSGGQLETSWPPAGRTWAAAPARPLDLYPVSNGDGTLSLAWTDLRDSAATYFDVYAQRLTDDGMLGLAEPEIHAIRDVPNDQGGKVTVYWFASAYDTLPADPISEYDVWRELDGVAANRALAAGARRASPGVALRPGDLRARRNGLEDTYWEFVGGAPSRGVIDYALTVNTRGDSTATDPARETYEVDVHGGTSNYIATSDPDSGYSVDNLPPLAPTPFTDAYDNTTGSSLAWGNNIETDLAGYRLYRGATWGFLPSPANRIYQGAATSFHDAGGPVYYKLSAYDIHGNEGPYAIAHGGNVGAPDATLPRELGLSLQSANPARGAAELRLDLPRPAWVDLAVFDPQGRRERLLWRGAEPAGELVARWDGRSDAGAEAPAGLYFVRMESEGRSFTRRVVLVR